MAAGSAGYSAAEMKEAEDAWRNAQPMRAGCGLCNWKLDGPASEVLQAQKDHREGHGITKRRSRRHLRSLTRFQQNSLTDIDLAEIDVERRQRALLTGVEIED